MRLNRQTGKWRAVLRGYGKNGYIGEFSTESEASEARIAAEISIHGGEHEAPSIEVRDSVAFVPIMGAKGRRVATAVVDEVDLPTVGSGRWNLVKSGYAVQRRAGKYVYMHRLIEPRGAVADHSDGDRLNNRRENLRPCSQVENSRNRRRLSKNNSSGAKGVSRTPSRSKPWRARIWVARKEILLGRYATKGEALDAYAKASAKHHGEFGAPVAELVVEVEPFETVT